MNATQQEAREHASVMTTTALYRDLLREVYKSSISPRATRNKALSKHFRSLLDETRQQQNPQRFAEDIGNAILFMRSQRTHKALLERYNPTSDLTTEERNTLTTRRVGLDMPTTYKE